MAILNCTPDSFSGDGTLDCARLVTQALAAVAAGASILDLGAESTRPGSARITSEEEALRLLPAVRAIRRACPDVVISVDTTKPDIFRRAYDAGADWLNSVAGLPDDLLDAVRTTSAKVVVADAGGAEGGGTDAILERLADAATRAHAAGIGKERIILDPGFGFGKTPAQNIAILRELPRFVERGYPTVLGASRKSTLGRITGADVSDRDHATSATTSLAVLAGVAYVRVHNVTAAAQIIAVMTAVLAPS